MRLQVTDYGFASQLPENEQESTIENSAKMFSILSDGLYKNKILSVIRELSCNARDAHHDAGKLNVPFTITLPNYLEPTFKIEDYGVGIPPAEMRNIYLTYGRSTKTEDDNAIGALGLGSKSPFAYTKSSFIVKTRWFTPPSTEAVEPISEYVFFIFINARGKPALSLVGVETTDQPKGGLTVEFAVKTEDINQFIVNVKKFYRYWRDVLPTFKGGVTDDQLRSQVEIVLNGGGWYLEKRDAYADFSGAYAVMGNVPYPILADSVVGLPEHLKVIAKNPFIINFDLGALAFAPSREDLSYDEFTCKNLIARLEQVRDEVTDSFRKKIFARNQTQIEFRRNFKATVNDLGRVIRVDRYSMNTNEWVSQFMLNKKLDETVEFDGYHYQIRNLINDAVKFDVAGYQPYNIIARQVRGRNHRVYLSACTSLQFRGKRAIKYEEIYSSSSWTREVKVGDTIDFEWGSKVFLPRKDDKLYTNLQRAFLLEKDFEITTQNSFNVKSSGDVIFVVNDEGSAGEYKFKCFIEKDGTAHDYFFIRHNLKEIEPEDVEVSVKEMVKKNGLKGAKVVMLSTLEDHRPPIAKVKTDPTTIKLCTHHFCSFPAGKPTVINVYGDRKARVINSSAQKYSGHVQTLFKVSELANGKTWLYVIKTRTKQSVYDRRILANGEDLIPSCVDPTSAYHDAFKLSVASGFFDDVHHSTPEDQATKVKYKKFPILVLNEGQVKWLLGKGVKLVQIREQIVNEVKKKLTAHNFIEEVAEEEVMEEVSILGAFFSASTAEQRDRIAADQEPVTFFKYFKEYMNYVANKDVKIDSFALMMIYRLFVDYTAKPDTSRAEVIKRKLDEEYPLLKLVNFQSVEDPADLDHLLDYIKAAEMSLK